MKPRKAKEFIEEHAQNRGVPEEDMEDMIRGFYDAIRMHATNLEHINIRIAGIGNLKVRQRRVDEFIDHLQRLSVNNNVGFFQMEKNNDLLERLNRIVEIRNREYANCEMQRQEKLLYKEKRMRHDNKGNTATGME